MFDSVCYTYKSLGLFYADKWRLLVERINKKGRAISDPAFYFKQIGLQFLIIC